MQENSPLLGFPLTTKLAIARRVRDRIAAWDVIIIRMGDVETESVS